MVGSLAILVWHTDDVVELFMVVSELVLLDDVGGLGLLNLCWLYRFFGVVVYEDVLFFGKGLVT